MKQIASYNDKPLRDEQFDVFVDLIQVMSSRKDLVFMLDHSLTESEKAYICQRLNVMRMLAKYFSYSQIRDKLGVTTSTISNANKILERGGSNLRKLLLGYKFEPTKHKEKPCSKPLVNPHYPGAIKL